MIYTIAIVGRANVGKTTIFNRLVGKKEAIVADYSGVTRDRNEIICDYYDLKVKFVDAAGIEKIGKKHIIQQQMLKQAMIGLEKADLCLFVVDGKIGIINGDIEVFNLLRRKNKTTILIVNKSENPNSIDAEEMRQFNFVKDKILLSAEHNLGFGDLYTTIYRQYEEWNRNNTNIAKDENVKHCKTKIRIAIIGRPNAGKSTFLNNLLNEERLIVSDISGTTRDKIEIDFSHNGQDFVLIDTAGIRKKYKNGDTLELASIDKSLEALQFADVAVVIMDITIALEEQDLSICQKVCNEGRILIVCFNKWDLVPKNKADDLLQQLKKIICKSVAQVKGIVFFTCSAKNDRNLFSILTTIEQLYNKWNMKISAGQMNKKIETAKLTTNAINELKIRYISQIKIRPPTFVVFSGKSDKNITLSKIESIKNWIYREFNLTGVPIRLSVRGKQKK